MKHIVVISFIFIIIISLFLSSLNFAAAYDVNLALPFHATTGWEQGGWGSYIYPSYYGLDPALFGLGPTDPFVSCWFADNTQGRSPAIRVDRDIPIDYNNYSPLTTANGNRELDDYNPNQFVFPVGPGDNVYFGVYVKMNPSNIGGHSNGVRYSSNPCVDVDFFTDGGHSEMGWASNGFLCDVFGPSGFQAGYSPNWASDLNAFAPTGCDWTWIYVDVTVPNTIMAVANGQQYTPIYFCPILFGGLGNNNFNVGGYQVETASCWFADPVLYINPSGVTPPPPTSNPTPTATPNVPLYSVNFAFKDLSSNVVGSGVSWQLYSGATPISYTMGARTLTSGFYSLKTYYFGHLVNVTGFNVINNGAIYPVQLNVKQGSYFSIAANNTLSSLTVNSENATSVSFTATGSSGPYMLIIPCVSQASFVNLNGVSQAYGSGWIYDQVNHCIVVTAASLPAS